MRLLRADPFVPSILIDRHHAGLLHAMQLLFEDRLGMDLYVPVGHDWWDQGYWRFGEVYGDDRLAQQYLMPEHWTAVDDGYETRDVQFPDRLIHGAALGRHYDFICATVQENQTGFARLAAETGATYVLQVGNINQDVDRRLHPLALVSNAMPLWDGAVRMHQEFDSDGLFGFRGPGDPTLIRSFVNVFESMTCHRWFLETETAMPEVRFRSHGIGARDGNISPTTEVARLMRESGWGWHDKVQGDGFGHVIHMWAALGRPLIGHGSHYHGQMASIFWEDGVTCIDLDRHDTADAVRLLREVAADPPRYAEMCRAIRARFDAAVDYEAEAATVRTLLGR